MKQIIFHGVRGSIACPGPRHARYGGNTSAIEVLLAGRRILLDGGTGIRALGDDLVAAGGRVELDLLLTHGHIDHLVGIPFFQPLFEARNRIRIHGPDDPYALVHALMQPPLFPIDPGHFQAEVSYHKLVPGQIFSLGDGIEVATLGLVHPGGALGYRLQAQGSAIVYATDLEHGDPEFEARLVAFAQGCDVLIYDSTYDARCFERFRGFGHSTWQMGAQIAQRAKVGTFVATHHDPSHDDARLDAIAAELLDLMPNALLAREGLCLSL